MPYISVVMATCNGSPYLARQLESILDQSRPPDEIVIVDDCSEDETVAVARHYADRATLRIEVNATRLGPIKNFEKALSLARGELIFFSDQDDIWERDKIEVMAGYGGGVDFLYSDATVIDEHEQQLCASEIVDYHDVRAMTGNNYWYFINNNCVSGHNAMVSRRLVEYLLPFPEFVMYDQWLALVAALQARVEFVDRQLCRHRIHSRNFCNNQRLLAQRGELAKKPRLSRQQRFLESQHKVRQFVDYLQERGLTQPVMAPLLAHFAKLEAGFFDWQLFRVMLADLDYYFPNHHGLNKLDKAIKFCRLRRGYWLPGLKL